MKLSEFRKKYGEGTDFDLDYGKLAILALCVYISSIMNQVKDAVASLKNIPKQQELLDILKTGVLVVTFNKLDGDERVMTCTKNNEHIPEESRPKTDKVVKEGTITVWDLNAKGWRSFKYDRVTKVEGGGTVKIIKE